MGRIPAVENPSGTCFSRWAKAYILPWLQFIRRRAADTVLPGAVASAVIAAAVVVVGGDAALLIEREKE